MLTKRKMICMIVMGAMISVSFLLPLYGQDPLRGWQFKSEGTHGIILVSVEESGIDTSLIFKNVSDKVVMAFAMSLGAGSGDSNTDLALSIDCFGQDLACLKPGAVYARRFRTDTLTQSSDHTVTIRAVLFGDDTGEGSPGHLRRMRALHLGIMLETERIKRILAIPNKRAMGVVEPGVSATDGDIGDEEAKAMVEKVGSLPRSAKEAIESLADVKLPGASVENVDLGDKRAVAGFQTGVSTAREDALRSLDALRQLPGLPQGNPPVKTRGAYFSQLKQHYERLSAKDQEFRQHAQGGELR
jgi:hypothetical protein